MNEVTPANLRDAEPVTGSDTIDPTALPAAAPEASLPDIEDGTQDRLLQQAVATLPPWAQAVQDTPAISDARKAQIDQFVADNASDRYGLGPITFNDVGGTRVGEALLGESDNLGALDAAERAYLSEAAVARWSADFNETNVSEAADAVRDDPAAARALAQALAMPSADTARLHARGIDTVSALGSGAFNAHAVDTAVMLDPVATIEAYAGVEDSLAGAAAFRMDIPAQQALLGAVGRGDVEGAAADRLATAMFVHTDRSQFETGLFTDADETLRGEMAQALAMATHPGTDAAATAQRALLADRLEGLLATEGGRDLLVNENVRPEQRLWALDQVAQNPSWDAQTIDNGWESDIVTTAFAEVTMAQYANRDPAGEVLRGDALRNTVGIALGQQADLLPPENETAAARDARLADGITHGYFSDASPTAEIARRIELATQGDPEARISVVPITITNNEFGVAQVPVFRIDRSDGTTAFVDNEGGTYRDLAHWEAKNELPQGRFAAADGLDLRADLAAPDNTRRVIDTWTERAGDIGDKVALGVGIGAGVALATIAVVGSGGAAVPFLLAGAAGAGGWTATRAGSELYDDHQRGHDILDWSDPDNRSRWLDVAAGTLSVGAIGAGMRAAHLGQQATTGLTRFAAATALAADGVDVVAMGDQALQMAGNWNDMSNGDRAMGLLNMAFYGGMAVASTRAGGLDPRDMGSFQRMDNTFRTGTPYPLTEGALPPGQSMRVDYTIAENGRATDIRILTDGTPPDPQMLALHTQAARQIERAGGLQDQLRAMMGGQQDAPVGSAAWEAGIEIDKITAESRLVARELSARDLTPERAAQLETRQRELTQALERESLRLSNGAADPNGFVAAPRSLDEMLAHYGSAERGDIVRGVPDHLPRLTAPNADTPGVIDYGSVNAQGQAVGIQATITADMLGTGTHARQSIQPPGWEGGAANHSRGHLLARMLGGSGDDSRNLVTLFQRNTNSPVMRDFETAVAEAVAAGETVNYRVTPIYDGDGLPVSIAMSARGSDGFELDITILNRDGR